MKYINILLFSLVLIACGKSDKQTQTKTEDQDNDSLIFQLSPMGNTSQRL